MTTSMAASPPTPIDAKNVNEIWKNNFTINNNNNNNNNSKTPTNGVKFADLNEMKTWASLNNNNNQIQDQDQVKDGLNLRTISMNGKMNAKNDKTDSDTNSNTSSNNCKIVEVEKLSNDDGNYANDAVNDCNDAHDGHDGNHGNGGIDVNDGHEGNDMETGENNSPSHHARRPMNAFLIFCKKHRPIVRNIFPALENRGVTRILGEWWSLLDGKDKDPYTKLAKQYKDAFFTANPNFKWYKLPAPPLRTLPTRPAKVENSPPSSPISSQVTFSNFNSNCTNLNPNTTNPQSSQTSQISASVDFTPGKLADETQLGKLTALFTPNTNTNNISSKNSENLNINNNNSNNSASISSENETESISEPPRPRLAVEIEGKTTDNLQISEKTENSLNLNTENNQDLLIDANNGRKSYRKGKGNRYADIMASGKLIKNKRSSSTDKLMTVDNTAQNLSHNFNSNTYNNNNTNPSSNHTNNNPNPNTNPNFNPNLNHNLNPLELNTTIKKLQERLNSNTKQIQEKANNLQNTSINNDTSTTENSSTTNLQVQPNQNQTHQENNPLINRVRTISEFSEMSDVADYSKAIPSFDLDARIGELPNLSYDAYVQRKKEMKKRKLPKGGNTSGKTQKYVRKNQSSSNSEQTKSGKLNNLNNKRKFDFDDAIESIDKAQRGDLVKNGSKINYINNNSNNSNQNEKQTGSKKRKNKHNITHLKNNTSINAFENDMSGLNTLAEIASNLSNNNNNNNNDN